VAGGAESPVPDPEGRPVALFGRRNDQPPQQGRPPDLPPLYPTFYVDMLQRAGKPLSEANAMAVAEFTAWRLTQAANTWFTQLGDPSARASFRFRFTTPGASPADVLRTPDEMIDYLYDWDRRVHAMVRPFVTGTARALAGLLPAFGPDLPPRFWED
jgi:hypothetical protein